ncbi:MAG: outer membrane protein [Pseudomonadota bacterium]
MSRFKIMLLSGLAGLAMATSATAADLPSEQAFQQTPVDARTYNWEGVYVGASVGFGFSGEFDDGGALAAENANGFVGGGIIGYNKQFDRWVVGLESEFSYTNLDVSAPVGVEADLDFIGTVTGRVGYTPTERILTYVEGGYAFGQIDVTAGGASDSNIANGFVVGAGADYALTENISTGVEYNYINHGDETFNVGGGTTSDFDGHTVRFNLKYKF